MTTKPKTLEQLDEEVATLENNIDREIDTLHRIIDEANDLVSDVFNMEDELFNIRDELEELQAIKAKVTQRLAKKPSKGDNMKAPKKKVAPKKKKAIPKKKTPKKKASLKEINPLHEATRMAKDSLKVLLRNSKTTPKKRSKK